VAADRIEALRGADALVIGLVEYNVTEEQEIRTIAAQS
jgi:hypothetical protein